jgi:hypothetical protein
MEAIAVTAALLRAQLPDVTLRAGSTVMARVASRGETHAVLVLAGIPVTAKIPPEVQAGATLKLRIQEVTPERITLQIEPQPQAAPLAAPAPQPPPPRLGVEEPPSRRRGPDGEPVDVVALAFTSPTLGRLDLRLELRGERLLAEVTTPPGVPFQVASGSAERLRAKLAAVGLAPTVNIRPRRPPIDLYA